jgi:hypothetical protein
LLRCRGVGGVAFCVALALLASAFGLLLNVFGPPAAALLIAFGVAASTASLLSRFMRSSNVVGRGGLSMGIDFSFTLRLLLSSLAIIIFTASVRPSSSSMPSPAFLPTALYSSASFRWLPLLSSTALSHCATCGGVASACSMISLLISSLTILVKCCCGSSIMDSGSSSSLCALCINAFHMLVWAVSATFCMLVVAYAADPRDAPHDTIASSMGLPQRPMRV